MMDDQVQRPDRPADEELFGEGPPPYGTRVRVNEAYYGELFIEGMGDETYPRGWWAAKIWKGP
jgi:hypothetical protein